MWITNGPDADTLVVYAKTDPNAGAARHHRLHRREGHQGPELRQKLDKLGMRGSNTWPLFFEDCEVPAENVLGGEGERRQGADERPRLRARGAVRRAARHHGGLHGHRDPLRARPQAVRPEHRRVPADPGQGGRHVHHLQACRAYVYTVGQACDRGDHARTLRKDAAGAILCSAEKATWMAGEAIQTLGGNGYINEYPIGRLWRDAKLYEIGAGTSEIRRMLIGRELFAETVRAVTPMCSLDGPVRQQPRLGRPARQRSDPDFFTPPGTPAGAAATCGSAAPTAACRPTRSSAWSRARCSCTATSPTSWCTPT